MILATYILELNFIRSFVLSFLIKLKGIKKKNRYTWTYLTNTRQIKRYLNLLMPNKLRILSKL